MTLELLSSIVWVINNVNGEHKMVLFDRRKIIVKDTYEIRVRRIKLLGTGELYFESELRDTATKEIWNRESMRPRRFEKLFDSLVSLEKSQRKWMKRNISSKYWLLDGFVEFFTNEQLAYICDYRIGLIEHPLEDLLHDMGYEK